MHFSPHTVHLVSSCTIAQKAQTVFGLVNQGVTFALLQLRRLHDQTDADNMINSVENEGMSQVDDRFAIE